MRSPVSLGIVFLALPALLVAGVPGAHVGPVGWALCGLLGVAGLLVMTRVRAAYYVGLAAGTLTAISGIIAWAGVGGGRFGLPGHPGFATVIGLYLCMRVAVAHRMFGPDKTISRPTQSTADGGDGD